MGTFEETHAETSPKSEERVLGHHTRVLSDSVIEEAATLHKVKQVFETRTVLLGLQLDKAPFQLEIVYLREC
jgi:hypothetical protein